MTYQTTEGLNKVLAEWGCFFLCIIRIAEKTMKVEFTVKQINSIFEQCVRIGYVSAEADIKYKATRGIAQIISALSETDVYLKRMEEAGEWNHLIGHFTRVKHEKRLHHFVLMEALTEVEYDPWSAEGSRTVREGTIMDYRYIFGEVV